MYSMTGFGKANFTEGGVTVGVELKSVNNRFLDISVRSPRALSPFEELVRSLVRENISRGHVDVFLSFIDTREREKKLFLDKAAVRAYLAAANELKEEFPDLTNDVTVSYLLRLPDVMRAEEEEEADGAVKAALVGAVQIALNGCKTMRKEEGERLKRDLLSRVARVEELTAAILSRAPLVAGEYRKKITERMEEYLKGKVDETRILTEAAIFSDKCNIDEELTRLTAHIASFREIAEGEIVGRKLDFLVQEFNRECNTICSKSNDKAITASALDMKNEIEKIREQIQNLE